MEGPESSTDRFETSEEEQQMADQNRTVRASDMFDEDGNIIMSELLDENGNPVKNYPLPPNPHDRRSEFENTLMHAYMTKKALDEGTEPPPRKYQSEFDRKFHMWMDRNWDRWCRLRTWSETNAPRSLRIFDKTHDVMFWVGEKCADALGLTQSRYQWVINAAESQAYDEMMERQMEEDALREMEEEEEARLAAEELALEGGAVVDSGAGVEGPEDSAAGVVEGDPGAGVEQEMQEVQHQAEEEGAPSAVAATEDSVL